MVGSIYKKIYKKIKKYNTIIITRHVGADPDALASQIGLRDVILNTFPKKKVYAVGFPSSKFKYLGMLDKVPDEEIKDALLLVLDTPDQKRVDGITDFTFADSVKIDHHPFVEKFCKLEWIDDKTSSTAQMVVELILNTPLQMSKEAAEKLFLGIVADTNRFLFSYTTPKTFELVSKLIQMVNLDFTSLYDHLYMRSLKEVHFEGFLSQNIVVTENGFGYVKITEEMLKQYEVDAATAGNMVNHFNYIENIYAWAFFTEDTKNENIRGSIRSRGPIINDVASKFNGGGHIYASGVRLTTFEQTDELIKLLDQRCKEYRNGE